jgi:hypothetical protein
MQVAVSEEVESVACLAGVDDDVRVEDQQVQCP